MHPRLAIVSTDIRRDLLAPIRNFTRLELVHLYRLAVYNDLTGQDLEANLQRYASPGELYRRLVRANPDIIQGVEPFSLALQPFLWACYLAVRRTRARLLVVTPESRPLEIKYGRLAAPILRRALRIYFARAGQFIVLNQGARLNLEACGVPTARIRRLMWATWGVDVEEFSPHAHGQDHLPTILFAGRLHESKGILVLLDAFARVRETVPESQLVIVGDGPARQAVERRAAALRGVSIIGPVKNRAMPGFFREADVLAMPSLTTPKWEEQVGMVALQAMACGLPVVATRSGAIPEYVPDGGAGILVPERDASALAAALCTLLRDEKLRAGLSVAARRYALEHYDARVNITRAEDLLLEWLAREKDGD